MLPVLLFCETHIFRPLEERIRVPVMADIISEFCPARVLRH